MGYKYQINKDNYHQFDILEINKLAPRSYFIPFPTKEEADAATTKTKRYTSSKVRCLNGEWDFKFYPIPAAVPDVLDTDETVFEQLDVPSCWQFRGYDKPFYVNCRYQFPYNPPEIPKEEPVGRTFCWVGSDLGVKPRWQTPEGEYNFVGIYRKTVDVGEKKSGYILNFLGVASCVDVYVNGQFVGYSEGAHNMAEFDISKHICDGENEIIAVLHRWCTGTYLEAQDMFRNNGIFRDVLLYELNETDIMDVDFRMKKMMPEQVKNDACAKSETPEQEKTPEEPKGTYYRALASVTLTQDASVTFMLCGNGISETVTVESKDKTAVAKFDCLNVQEWNAETPVLYDLYYEIEGTCVKQRVGFKDIEIKDTVYYLNGHKIKFRGVNHHDTSCTNGFAMTPDEIERDVLLCKEYNIDTVRTSHYPPDPLFLELCDELGVYVVDEADIETHGTFSQQFPPNYNSLSHNPKWENRFMDRVKRLYHRDKNHISVILWSLGNESGGYANTDKMYKWLKTVSRIPVHYESVVHSKRKAYDVGSEMYPPVANVHLIGEKKSKTKQFNDRPYFLCEYAHAMGVGPGNIESYWKEIYAYDNLMGGCVWEMVDHAVLHEDGRYTYGGDHGEWEHDGNFCVDGIFYPDRTPSTGAKLVRFTYRPLRITYMGGNRFEVFNTMAFSDGTRYRLRYKLTQNGVTVQTGETQVAAAPLSKTVAELELPAELAADSLLTITTVDSKTETEVATEQIALTAADLPVPKTDVAEQNFVSYAWQNGKPEINIGKSKLECAVPYTILFRAPTDNDVDFLMKSTQKDFIVQKEQVVSVDMGTDSVNDKITVVSKIECKKHTFTCTDIYESCEEGVLVTSKLHCDKGNGFVPRFGKAFRLDAGFDTVEYMARNGESYIDMKEQAQIERVTCKVADMTEPNIRPQESGNRCDCRYVSLSDGTTKVTFRAVEKPFELGIKPYSDVELLSMKHREDEVQSGTYVTISAFQMGIGTGSCGPATAEEHKYPVKEDYELKFVISWK